MKTNVKSKNHIFAVTIEGWSILQSRHPSPEQEEKIRQLEEKDKTGKKKPSSDEEQYKMHEYRLDNGKGKYYQPAEMLEAAMVKAATAYRIPGEGKKTYKDLFKGGVVVTPIEVVHKNQKFYADKCFAKNRTVGAVWVVRPRCDDWELSFNVEVIQWERIPDEVIEEVLAYAGNYVGIGAWRPKYGRFQVTSFKRIN